ncbi:MAG: ATP-binding protein, partial [Oscillospiraceae bacterium]
DTYINVTLSRVTKKDFHGEIRTIAVAYNQIYDGIDIDLAENVRTVHYDTRKEAMQAVRDGKADACYIYTYMAEKFINQNPDGELIFHIVNKPAVGLAIGIRPTTDHELISILNKCLKADQSPAMDELVEKYTSYEQPEVTLEQFVRNNPWVIIALISIISAVGIIIFLIVRNNNILRSVARERQTYAESLQEKNIQLKESVKQAQSANLAKTSFLSNMSHDIRTPMNAIIGFTNIAKKQNKQEDVGKCLDKIEESSEHLLTLINDVLDISRIESGKIVYEPYSANITKVIDAVISIVQGFMTGRDLTFRIKRTHLETPYVITDPVRVREVLVNILSNAVKFTEDGGSITFTADYRKLDGEKKILVRYTVTDTGIGMSEEYLGKIFDEFSQENTGARTQYKGTGLGMPITKRYVEMMGGTISVEKRKGRWYDSCCRASYGDYFCGKYTK